MFRTIQTAATHRKRGGFTLIEVVFASAIVMLSAIAIVNAFSYARRTVSVLENRLACLHIARTAMENLRSQSYSVAALSVGTNKTLPGYPSARGYYNVVQGSGETKDITVVVKWVEPTGRTNSVSLTSTQSRGLHK